MPLPRLSAAACLILLGGCAAVPPAVEADPAKAANPGSWERAPTPRLIERRYDVFGGSVTRGRLGWPDRWAGDTGGGPFRPRY